MIRRLALDITVPLDRFDLAVAWDTGESFLGIFGASGAGKTTILEALAGLRPAARGTIRVDGRTWLDSAARFFLPPERRGVGYVPQEGLLFPHRDVRGNLLAGRERAARSDAHSAAGRPDLEKVLDVLELGDLQGRDVRALSGGERQRVALGRALCSGPELLLLDEPLAGLDVPLRRRILTYLLRVRMEFAIPTLYVSHDPTEVAMLCDEVLALARGRIVKAGRPEELFTDPAVLPMARAEGFENVLRGTVAEIAGAAAALTLGPGLRIVVPSAGLASGREAIVGLRAEDLILATQPPAGLSAQNILPGTIREIRGPDSNGAGDEGGMSVDARGQVQVLVGLAGARPPIVVTITPRACESLGLAPGRPVHLVFKAQACRVLASM